MVGETQLLLEGVQGLVSPMGSLLSSVASRLWGQQLWGRTASACKPLGPWQSEISPEAGTGLLAAAEAAAQASAVFPAPEAGCGSANQGSELLETGCVLAPVGTPQGSTEAAGLAPEGRQDKFRDALTKF